MNVEIILNQKTHHDKNDLIVIANEFLHDQWDAITSKFEKSRIFNSFDQNEYPDVYKFIKSIIINCELPKSDVQNIDINDIKWFVYALDNEGPVTQTEDGNDQDGPIDLATHLMLPSAEFFSLWENLHYEDGVKENLLSYAQTMMEFSDRGVDNNVINCNRIILLHGPPGTGKTSLCKALGQKLAIRMQNRYANGLFIEINSHSLFSKWFSESGKLVANMFKKIKEAVDNPQLLVCVLIDEIESLAHARNQCISGNEPSDSVRVVNAVLTQIDQIKRHSNVLILTTSNLTESIDVAFIDRADIKQYLGLPNERAIQRIFISCIEALHNANIIKQTKEEEQREDIKAAQNAVLKWMKPLENLCKKSIGLSGRSLRKIPFIAHALFVKETPCGFLDFVLAMDKAVDREFAERKFFKND